MSDGATDTPECDLSDHEGRDPDDTEEAEKVLREALGDEVVDEIQEVDDGQ